VVPALAYRELYSDKAYEYLTRHPDLPFTVLTPVKKQKGQDGVHLILLPAFSATVWMKLLSSGVTR
jgi:hypothetical protein